MKELTCNCGFTVKNEDPSVAEAKMWYHAIDDHIEMLKSMTEEQLVGWLTETHKKLGLES
ncbi:hypothetical protein SAMN05877753_104332 [Bacillus oleivorans]|uniref:DUF1059 domain-containing protein n=1 Tax=Bacillus oleivorans TaxID=1448271 RepID=A0A285CV00_9BACI|nr:hypothetical protein [Bacillus oleivorans]SNX70763.1 hypothetical protein SAMN05877753_104332 [Bacillus oleivorans]